MERNATTPSKIVKFIKELLTHNYNFLNLSRTDQKYTSIVTEMKYL